MKGLPRGDIESVVKMHSKLFGEQTVNQFKLYVFIFQ